MGHKCCSMGRVGAQRGGLAGAAVGGAVGALPWAVAGSVMASSYAVSETVGQGTTAVAAAGGVVTAGVAATVVGLPCAVIGGVLGATAGSAQDLASAAVALAHSTENRIMAARLGRTRSKDRGLRGAEGTGQVAQLPAEALPLLCALVVARRREVLTEEEAFEQAAALASACGEGETTEEILARAQREGREVLSMVKLCEAYPGEKKSAVRAVAKSLVETTDPDVLDAAWILCGNKPLSTWCAELRSRQPLDVSGVSSELMEAGLHIAYELERPSLVEALGQYFPGGPSSEAYGQRLDELKAALPRSSFWKGYCMFRAGKIPEGVAGLTFDDLCTDDFARVTAEFLSRSFALCIEELDPQDGTSASAPACSMMSAAVRASAPLAPVEALGGRSLRVEVLSLEHLGSPEYRLGDITSGLMRSVKGAPATRNLYVEVKLGNTVAQTRVVRNSTDRADIGECLALPCSEPGQLAGETLLVRVYDARGVQAAIRGDPLIGEAHLHLSEVDMGESRPWTLQLQRGTKSNQGRLLIRVGVAASAGDYRTLANASEAPLADLSRALGHVLSQPSGVETLMETRPKLRDLTSEEESRLRELLRGLVKRLRRDAELASGLSDQAALVQLARTVRAVRELVAISAAEDLSGEEVQELAQAWLHALLLRCLPPGSSAPPWNEERVARLLGVGAEAPQGMLSSMGASMPDGVPEILRAAVASRLAEALQAEEDEIFTGERMFTDRRLRTGMAAVIRSGRDSGRPHVFLYDLDSIRQWQAARGEDPSTRERLYASDIVPLS